MASPKLQPWQASIARKAKRLRKHYSVKALSDRWGVDRKTIFDAASGVTKAYRK